MTAYRIETQRLVLRCWNPVDAPLLSRAVDESREHLRPWMPWIAGEPKPLDARMAYMRSMRAQFDTDEEYVYGVFDPSETTVLGGCGLHRRLGPKALEIGYWIHADHVRRGLATELSGALTRVAFGVHDVARVEIHCDPANVASAGVPRRLGYRHDGTLRGRLVRADGSLRDTMIWSIQRGEPVLGGECRAFDALGRPLQTSDR